MTKKHDTAKTPYRRALNDPTLDITDTARLTEQYHTLNPVAIQREILALTDALAHMVTADITLYPDTARLLLAGIPS